MKLHVVSLITLTLITTLGQFASADCEITVNRTACPGKEVAAYKPYNGKNPTVEVMKKAKSADACLKEGEKSSKIIRTGTLSKKTVTISFDGKALGEKSDSKDCK